MVINLQRKFDSAALAQLATNALVILAIERVIAEGPGFGG
jgi:hypothetical protein